MLTAEERHINFVDRVKTGKFLRNNLSSQKKLKRQLKRLETEAKEYAFELGKHLTKDGKYAKIKK